MKLRPRLTRPAWTFVATAFLIFAPTLWFVTPAFDWRAACERGSSWARSNHASLPRTMAELAAFPSSIRRAIFSALPPETKSSMWQTQLQAFADQHALSPEQARSEERRVGKECR